MNLPDSDAQQIKQFAAVKAHTGVAGSFDSAVRGEAALQIAHGVADGNVGAQPGIIAGMMMGVPVAPGAPTAGAAAAVPSQPVPSAAGPAHFCTQCGTAVPAGSHFCPSCGAAIAGSAVPASVPEVTARQAPGADPGRQAEEPPLS